MGYDIPINRIPPPKRHAVYTVRVPLREHTQPLTPEQLEFIGGRFRDAVYYLKELHESKQVTVQLTRIETPKVARSESCTHQYWDLGQCITCRKTQTQITDEEQGRS